MFFALQSRLLELFLRVPNQSFEIAVQTVDDNCLQNESNDAILKSLQTLTLSGMLLTSLQSVYGLPHYVVSKQGLELCVSLNIVNKQLDELQRDRLIQLISQEQNLISIQEKIVELLKRMTPFAIPTLVVYDYLQSKKELACDWMTTVSLLSKLATNGIVVNSCNGLLWHLA